MSEDFKTIFRNATEGLGKDIANRLEIAKSNMEVLHLTHALILIGPAPAKQQLVKIAGNYIWMTRHGYHDTMSMVAMKLVIEALAVIGENYDTLPEIKLLSSFKIPDIMKEEENFLGKMHFYAVTIIPDIGGEQADRLFFEERDRRVKEMDDNVKIGALKLKDDLDCVTSAKNINALWELRRKVWANLVPSDFRK